MEPALACFVQSIADRRVRAAPRPSRSRRTTTTVTPAGPDVLLGAGVEAAVPRRRPAGGRGSWTTRRATSGTSPTSGHLVELHAADGLVGRDVDVRGVLVELPRRARGNRSRSASSSLVAATRASVKRCASPYAFFDHAPGQDVVGRRSSPAQVQRHGGELRRGAALEEEHGVVCRGCPGAGGSPPRPRPRSRRRPRRGGSSPSRRARAPASRAVSSARLVEHGLGQGRGPGAEIVDPGHWLPSLRATGAEG